MKITTFNKKVAQIEGGKKSISIAQIAEVNKINNKLTNGELYKIIRTLPE